MSQWWLTNPQPSQLGITTIPLAAPIWTTLNAELATLKWNTDPATLSVANTAVDTDDARYLAETDKANVTYNATANGGAGSVSASASAAGAVAISPTALTAALAALGASAPANVTAARAAYIAAQKATPQDPVLISNLTTVVGAWIVAQNRKNTHNGLWGNATKPGSVIGGLAAVHALEVFFGGLPGGVVSRRTVTADSVASGVAPKISLAIANDYGRVPAGDVSLVVKKGGATVTSTAAKVADNAASFALGVLDAGTYDYTLSYPGDDQLAPFTEAGSFAVAPAVVTPDPTPTPAPVVVPAPKGPATPDTVTKVKASKVKGAVSKAPTSKKAGKYKVTFTTSGSAATGKVTIKLKKGKTIKTITGTLSTGSVTFSVPKLARGTWKVTIAWPGDANYLAASATGASIRVTK
jgi:Big-like domain-containing protein